MDAQLPFWVSVALAALPVPPQWMPIPLAEAQAMPTAELARRILPPDIASQVTNHETRENGRGGSYGVRFFARPEQVTPAMCRRRNFYAVSSDFNVRRGDEATRRTFPGVQIALSGDCAKVPTGGFAFVQPVTLEDGAIGALQWLADMQQRARRDGTLPVAVRCRSEPAPDPCAAGALAVFAGLRLDKVHIIDKRKDAGGAERWQVAVMPTGPGQLYFETLLTGSADQPEIALTWRAPAPF